MYSAQRPPGSPFTHRELYDDMLRQARLAEDVSLDSFWIAEHHFAGDGYAAAVIPVCAAVLGATHRLIAGTSEYGSTRACRNRRPPPISCSSGW